MRLAAALYLSLWYGTALGLAVHTVAAVNRAGMRRVRDARARGRL